MNILLGITGGIAAYKGLELTSIFRKRGHEVRTVLTPAATHLAAPLSFQTISRSPVGLDLFAEAAPREVQHIAWADWTDRMVIAPATANTVAKLAHGIADNLLTTIALACDRPLYIAPAMNTRMLMHPATQMNLRILEERGARIMESAVGLLACGITGAGRLPDPEEIADFVLADSSLLTDKKVLITAGPTSEPIDPVRAITNRSSGRMGYALAQAARDQGADVLLISGPVALEPPAGIRTVRVTTARDMSEAVMKEASSQDIIIACAAVSDYTPVATAEQKIKKTDEELVIRLKRTEDILARLGENKTYYLCGFAAETQNVPDYAREKLQRKHLDMIVANDVSDPAIGFESRSNAVTILTADGRTAEVPRASKQVIASAIIRAIAEDMAARKSA